MPLSDVLQKHLDGKKLQQWTHHCRVMKVDGVPVAPQTLAALLIWLPRTATDDLCKTVSAVLVRSTTHTHHHPAASQVLPVQSRCLWSSCNQQRLMREHTLPVMPVRHAYMVSCLPPPHPATAKKKVTAVSAKLIACVRSCSQLGQGPVNHSLRPSGRVFGKHIAAAGPCQQLQRKPGQQIATTLVWPEVPC